MMKPGRIHRLIRLMTILQVGIPMSPRELMDEIGVSRRTLFRYLECLRHAGVPVCHDQRRGYVIKQDPVVSSSRLNASEVLALMVMGRAWSRQPVQPLARRAMDALCKVLAGTDENICRACSELMACVIILPYEEDVDQDQSALFVKALRAANGQRACEVTLRDKRSSDKAQFVVEPHYLLFDNSHWQIIGRRTSGLVCSITLADVVRLAPLNVCFERDQKLAAHEVLTQRGQMPSDGVPMTLAQ